MIVKNWLTTLNAFWAYREAHTLSSHAGEVYQYMLYCFSRARWPEWAEIPLHSIAGRCSISISSVKKARAELIAAKMIDIISQGGRAHAKYRLRHPAQWQFSIEAAKAASQEAEERRQALQARAETPRRRGLDPYDVRPNLDQALSKLYPPIPPDPLKEEQFTADSDPIKYGERATWTSAGEA